MLAGGWFRAGRGFAVWGKLLTGFTPEWKIFSKQGGG
jgi:hypothetical protein